MAKKLSKIELELLLESMVEGVMFIDDQDRFVYFNKAAERMARFDPNLLIGKSITNIHAKRILPKVFSVIAELKSGEKVDFRTEMCFKSKHYELRVNSVLGIRKKYIGLLATITDITNRVTLEEQIKSLAVKDGLTGIFNLRQFYFQIEKEIRRSERYGRPLSLLFFDVDNFKEYNDAFGHVAGDEALKKIAEVAGSIVRDKVDTVYRYGGDEFTVILPETDLRRASVVARRLIQDFRKLRFPMLSLSIGIAKYKKPLSIPEFVEKADRAMYLAKKKGGNSLEIYRNPPR